MDDRRGQEEMKDSPLITALSQMWGISPDVIWQCYWIGGVVAAVVTLSILLFNHYRDYYLKLKKFIERDSGNIPSKEIDGGQVVGGAFVIFLCTFLWPALVSLAVAWYSGVAIVSLCKWIVNLPGDLVERKLVREQKNKMLTSPNEDVRWLAEKHLKKNRHDKID